MATRFSFQNVRSRSSKLSTAGAPSTGVAVGSLPAGVGLGGVVEVDMIEEVKRRAIQTAPGA
jgi:hypothetical protein